MIIIASIYLEYSPLCILYWSTIVLEGDKAVMQGTIIAPRTKLVPRLVCGAINCKAGGGANVSFSIKSVSAHSTNHG